MRFPWPAWTLLGVGGALVATYGLGELWLYDRTALARGELWRLWTAHGVHFSSAHLAWNLAAFVPAGLWLERLAPKTLALGLLLWPPALAFVLWVGDPLLIRYGGLSGLTTAVIAALAVYQIKARHPRRWFWGGLLVLLIGKIVAEHLGYTPSGLSFRDPTLRGVPLAHLAGLGLGALSGLISRPGPHAPPGPPIARGSS